MKLKGQFMLREIAGEILAIPVGSTALEMNGMIVLNPVSKVIWERLEQGTTQEEILIKVMDLFEVSADEARTDISDFLNQLKELNLLQD